MMFGYGNQMSGWMWLLMGFGQIVFWAALLGGIVLVYRWRASAASLFGQSLPGTPEQVLAGRFARGDIDESEYGHRLAVLHRHSHEITPEDL